MIKNKIIKFETKGFNDIVDITKEASDFASEFTEGLLNVFVQGSTLSVTTVDDDNSNAITITHSGGNTVVNEAGYGRYAQDWTKLKGGSNDDRGKAVTRDSSGNIYVGLATKSSLNGSNAGNFDAALVKYNALGTEQWTIQLGSTANDVVVGVATDSSQNAYIAGYTTAAYDSQTTLGGYDIFIWLR